MSQHIENLSPAESGSAVTGGLTGPLSAIAATGLLPIIVGLAIIL